MAKTKRIKTVTAGRLVFAVCYTQATITDAPRERAAKTRISSAARAKLNHRAAWQKLRALLCCNFGRGDLYVTLGYDDAHLPDSRKAAKARMADFLDRLRAARRRGGDTLKYVYNTETLQDDGTRRLHHHLIISAGAARRDYELIRSLWRGGDNIEIRQLGRHELYSDDFLEMAKYLTKEADPERGASPVGDRCFVGSRTLARPVERSEMVEDNVTCCAPPGAVILDSDSQSNCFGNYAYIVYMLPETRTVKRDKGRLKT